MTTTILVGDVRERLKDIPDASVQCVCTSPPYYGLRQYLPDDHASRHHEIGSEPTLAGYIAAMVEVFREVRRVLRDDGVCWLNIGDSYAGSWGNQGRKDERGTQRPINGPMMQPLEQDRYPSKGSNTGTIRDAGLKPKDLMMVPARLAIALQDDGWWIRSDVIWGKLAPMPESVTDRPTCAHEHIFLLTKNAKYFYDAAAVRTELAASSIDRLSQDVESQTGSTRANGGDKTNGTMKAVQRTDKQRGHSRRHDGFNDRWDAMSKEEQQAGGANLRNVWMLGPDPFSGAHFAVMPREIARRCIKAGSKPGDTILDPFGGSGTTALVADQLGRNAILIELNPAYAELARERITGDAPMFAEVEIDAA